MLSSRPTGEMSVDLPEMGLVFLLWTLSVHGLLCRPRSVCRAWAQLFE